MNWTRRSLATHGANLEGCAHAGEPGGATEVVAADAGGLEDELPLSPELRGDGPCVTPAGCPVIEARGTGDTVAVVKVAADLRDRAAVGLTAAAAVGCASDVAVTALGLAVLPAPVQPEEAMIAATAQTDQERARRIATAAPPSAARAAACPDLVRLAH